MNTIRSLFHAVDGINQIPRAWAHKISDYDLKYALFKAATGKPYEQVIGAKGATISYYPHWQSAANIYQPDWTQAWIRIEGDNVVIDLLTGHSTYAAFKKRGKSTKVAATFTIPREKINVWANVWAVAERLSGEQYDEYSLDLNIPEDEAITEREEIPA